MRKYAWLFASVCAAASCGLTAQAQTWSYVLQGTVNELSDPGGLFGKPGPGASFTLTYLADFSVGYRGGGGGGFGGGNWLIGGTSFTDDVYAPSARISPVSAVLQINGHELDFSGKYYGAVESFYNALDEPYGGFGESRMVFAAEAHQGDSGPLLSQIGTTLESPFSDMIFGGSIDTPMSLAIDGLSITGATSFSYVWGLGTPQQSTVSGDLTPTFYAAAAAIPEPQIWLLYALGLAAVLMRVLKPGQTPESR